MGLIKKWLLRRALRKKTTKSDMETIADEMLHEALREMQRTRSTANVILKTKMIRQESRKTLEDIHEMDEDEEEEEEERAPDMQEQVTQLLLNKFLGGTIVNNSAAQQTIDNPNLKETLSNLTPEQVDALKKKFLG